MKKLVLLGVILFSFFANVSAQKYAFVDTQYILNNIPEYKMAQTQLDDLSKKWQTEIEAKVEEIDRMYKSFQTDAVLLPEDIKKQRQEEILQKEKALNTLKKQRFGKDGELFKKREEFIKPLQEKVYNAIKTLADQRGYAIVFDRAGTTNILYANAKYDMSDEVLESMGYSSTEE
jgi:outer membrane protein